MINKSDNILRLRQQIIDALNAKQYPQQPIISQTDFEQSLNDRGLQVWSHHLETWDRLGIFHPAFRVRYDKLPTLSEEDICVPGFSVQVDDECPSITNYRKWNSIAIKHVRGLTFRHPSGVVLDPSGIVYHPYQIFRFHEIAQKCETILHEVQFESSDQSSTISASVSKHSLSVDLSHIKDDEAHYLRILLLLILIEDCYLPRVTGVILGNNGSQLEKYRSWHDKFDPHKVLSTTRFSVDDVKTLRQNLALAGAKLDSYENWYVLLRHVRADFRKNLKDSARLAWDYYSAAEVLGLFLESLTGVQQPHLDDLEYHNPLWKQQIFGVAEEEFDYERGNALPAVLRYYGIDPRLRVLAIFEGQSELAFTEAWLAKREIFLRRTEGSLYLRDKGLMFVAVQGASGFKSHHVKGYARLARNDGACVYVVMDTDEDRSSHERDLREWITEGLIDRIFDPDELAEPNSLPVGGMLWQPCFEEANFNRDELLKAWISTINNGKKCYNLNMVDINNAINKQRLEKPKMPWITCFEKVRASLNLPFSKLEIAIECAKLYDSPDKPIVRLLAKIFTVAQLSQTFRYEPPPKTEQEK